MQPTLGLKQDPVAALERFVGAKPNRLQNGCDCEQVRNLDVVRFRQTRQRLGARLGAPRLKRPIAQERQAGPFGRFLLGQTQHLPQPSQILVNLIFHL